MTTLYFLGVSSRFAPSLLQRLAGWRRRRRNRAVLRQVDLRLLLDAGLPPPEPILAAPFSISHRRLLGTGSAFHP